MTSTGDVTRAVSMFAVVYADRGPRRSTRQDSAWFAAVEKLEQVLKMFEMCPVDAHPLVQRLISYLDPIAWRSRPSTAGLHQTLWLVVVLARDVFYKPSAIQV